MSYTGRAEFLPLGNFTNGGEYFEGDLAREKKPKLSFALVTSYNAGAVRTGGQLGTFLYDSRNISTNMFDALFKYQGISLSGEYLIRKAKNPITLNDAGDQRYVYAENGQNYQGGVLFKNNIELVRRYSSVTPNETIFSKEKYKEQFTFRINKYIKGHRVKLQSDLTLEKSYLPSSAVDHVWIYRFQIETGI